MDKSISFLQEFILKWNLPSLVLSGLLKAQQEGPLQMPSLDSCTAVPSAQETSIANK